MKRYYLIINYKKINFKEKHHLIFFNKFLNNLLLKTYLKIINVQI